MLKMDKTISQYDFLSEEQDTIRHIKQQVAMQYTDYLTEQLAHQEIFRMYNREDLREMLIGVITGRGIIERNTHVKYLAADGYFEIISNALKDFANIDVAILQLSAPKSQIDRRFSQDQFSRDCQLQRFCDFYRSNFKGYTVESVPGTVKTYDDILGHVRSFFMCSGTQAKYSVIVYNGHGTPSGNISLEDETHQPSNTQLLQDIYRIRDECWSKISTQSACLSQHVRLPLHTKVIFAQCYGHLYEQPKEQLSVIQVVALSSETDPETTSYITWNYPPGTPGNVISASCHLELERYGRKSGRRSEFDILQDLTEEASGNTKDYPTQLVQQEPSPQDSENHSVQSHPKQYVDPSKKSKHRSLPAIAFGGLEIISEDSKQGNTKHVCLHEWPPGTVNDSKQGDTEHVCMDKPTKLCLPDDALDKVSDPGFCKEKDEKTAVSVNDDLPGSTSNGESQYNPSAVMTSAAEKKHQNEDDTTQPPHNTQSTFGCIRAINSTYSRNSVCDLLHPLSDYKPRDTIELTLDIASCRSSMCPDNQSHTSPNNVPQNTTERPIEVTEVLEDVVPGYNYRRISYLSKEEFQRLSYGEFLRRMHEKRQAQMSTDCPEPSSQQLVERRHNPGRRNVERWYCIYHSNVSRDIHSQTIHSRTYHSGPDTADHNGPDSVDHNSANSADHNSPVSISDHNGSDLEHLSPILPSAHGDPDSNEDHNGANSGDHNSPVSISDHNGPDLEHLSPIILSARDEPDSDHNVPDFASDHNVSDSTDHNGPVSLRDHNIAEPEHPSAHDDNDPASVEPPGAETYKVCCDSGHCVMS